MIVPDTNVIIDYLSNVSNHHVDTLKGFLLSNRLLMAPAVVTELYGTRKTDYDAWKIFVKEVPILDIDEYYWRRAGETRRKVLLKGLKSRLGDALIAQSCIDHDVPLLTRDPDFKPYAELCGLKLAID